MEKLTKLVSDVCYLATDAGEKVMRFYCNGGDVTFKADASPLTAADKVSHEFLMKSLQELLPEAPVVSEESDGPTDSAIDHAKLFWGTIDKVTPNMDGG